MKQNSKKVQADVWDLIFSTPRSKTEKMASRKILDEPVKWDMARDCIANYRQKFPNETHYIRFSSKELGDWLKDLPSRCSFDSLRIYLGTYTANILTRYNPSHASKDEGKISAFLVPYLGDNHSTYRAGEPNEGDEVDPYNMGEIYP